MKKKKIILILVAIVLGIGSYFLATSLTKSYLDKESKKDTKIDFSEMKIVLPRLFGEPVVDDAGNVVLNTLNYGNFISAVINFLILALVVFF
ncbi:hypothetical protein EGP98_03370, partial [bacterium]|nr:hypothetical protein [bacterium]